MEAFVALLRAVNVGGTGRLTMAELASLCAAEGFAPVRTLGASGNVVFRSARDEAGCRERLAARLLAHTGRETGVIVRSRDEVEAVCAANPFARADPARVMAIFTDDPVPSDPLAGASGQADEEVRPGPRAVFVFYPAGAGASRLRLPAARLGTARNMNTVRKLGELARALAPDA